MTLEMKHQEAFHNECCALSQMIVGSLLKLAQHPQDEEEIRKVIQSADTAMGNARFIKDKELEATATQIVKSFKGVKDVRKRIDEYTVAINQFGKLIMRGGVVPKGYRFVNGMCIFDNHIESIKNTSTCVRGIYN